MVLYFAFYKFCNTVYRIYAQENQNRCYAKSISCLGFPEREEYYAAKQNNLHKHWYIPFFFAPVDKTAYYAEQ